MLRVLVADDDAMIREIISAYLRSWGCDVLTASNGLEAVEVFRSCQDLIDLVLTDLMMPVMSGQEAARLIWAARPDVKVICMSGCPDACPPEGASFLSKPIQFDALRRAMSEAVDTPTSLDRSTAPADLRGGSAT